MYIYIYQSQKSELIALCAELGVSSEGSVSDILNRLEELLLYKDIYPKMFIKLQRTGGWRSFIIFIFYYKKWKLLIY